MSVRFQITNRASAGDAATPIARVARLLSWAIVGLAALQAALGLFLPSAYRDNALVRAAWHGNDLVTLVLAVPVLAVALVLARRGSLRARLVWLGMLDFTLYNYAFYLFGAAFNAHFLLYVALFALSVYALVLGLSSFDFGSIAAVRLQSPSVRWVAGYLLATARLIGGLWTVLSLGYLATGKVPGPVVETDHPTAVVFALDLTLLVPALLLAAVWLWQRRPFGFVLGTMLAVKGAVYLVGLMASTLIATNAGIAGVEAQLPLWGALAVCSTAASFALLRLVPAAAPTTPKRVRDMTPARALATWAAMIPVAFANGTLRQFGYQPIVGEQAAHQISCFTAIGGFALLVFEVTRRWRLRSIVHAWTVGLVWAGLTVAFETALGLRRGMTLPEVFADYAVWDGRFWPLVVGFVLVAPVLATVWRLRPARVGALVATQRAANA